MIHIAFDVGNVLVRSDTTPFRKHLSKTLNVSMEDVAHFMNRTQRLHDIGCTLMEDELRDHFGIKSPSIMDELMGYWGEAIQPADWMIERLDAINQKHELKIALLSNVGLEHAPRMEDILACWGCSYQGFIDKVTKHFSCYVGARKPTSIFFQSFLQQYPEWKGCGYIDDLQENLDASKAFGFRTFRFALSEITGDNYEEQRYYDKMDELEAFILAGKEDESNSRWH